MLDSKIYLVTDVLTRLQKGSDISTVDGFVVNICENIPATLRTRYISFRFYERWESTKKPSLIIKLLNESIDKVIQDQSGLTELNSSTRLVLSIYEGINQDGTFNKDKISLQTLSHNCDVKLRKFSAREMEPYKLADSFSRYMNKYVGELLGVDDIV